MNTQLDSESPRGAWSLSALLDNRLLRGTLKTALGVAATSVVAVTAAAIYNAFDEDLGPQAKALLVAPPMGKIDDGNGYIAFLGLVAPPQEDQMDWGRKAAVARKAQADPGFIRTAAWSETTRPHLKVDSTAWCKPDCAAEAKRDPATVAARLANRTNAQLLARYRNVRAAPDFSDLNFGALNSGASASYPALTAGAALALGEGALKAGTGDVGALVAELEQEVKFHRRMVESGRTLPSVMTGETLLARDLLAISELLRSDSKGIAPYLGRLHQMTAPPISDDGIQAAARWLAHENVGWAREWRRLFEAGGLPPVNRVMSLFIQPDATANTIAAVMSAEASLANVPAPRFDHERLAIRQANEVRRERPWYAEARNPVGKSLLELATSSVGAYVARFHDLRALARAVDLQVTLAERGIVEPAAIAAFVSGDGAKTHVDPYTERGFAFDSSKRALSYEPRGDSRWARELKKRRTGRVAIEL